MQLQWWPTLSSLWTHTYFRRICPRSLVNIDQHYPKKNCLEGNIIPCTFKMIILTSSRKIKGKEIRKVARVLYFNEITKLLFYLTRVMGYYFKQNERFKLKKYDPARTRTWNLLIRSQTPYPLGHEADIAYTEFYYYLIINCITNMHCNIVILCLRLNEERDSRDFYSFLFPFFCTLQILSL